MALIQGKEHMFLAMMTVPYHQQSTRSRLFRRQQLPTFSIEPSDSLPNNFTIIYMQCPHNCSLIMIAYSTKCKGTYQVRGLSLRISHHQLRPSHDRGISIAWISFRRFFRYHTLEVLRQRNGPPWGCISTCAGSILTALYLIKSDV